MFIIFHNRRNFKAYPLVICDIAMEKKWPIEIVSFPMKNGDVRIFHSFLYVSLPEAKPKRSWNGPPRRGLSTVGLSHRRAAVAAGTFLSSARRPRISGGSHGLHRDFTGSLW